MVSKLLLQSIPLILLGLLVIALVIPACVPRPDTAQRVEEYKEALEASRPVAVSAASENAALGLEAFGRFLGRISDKNYVRENTAKVYAPDAYLNDTLVTHRGPEEIEAYFIQTAEMMTSYEVTIDDTASSGNEHYVRWTMVFSAPKLNGGKPVRSVGMSHVRLNSAGQVTMHQDFWDSGMNIYGQIPVIGGAIEMIRRRLEK